MATRYADPIGEVAESNLTAAIELIDGFNTKAWDTVRAALAPDLVFHHPTGGTVAGGPEALIATWVNFKALSPDSWHPLPIVIAEQDYVAMLLPNYGTYNGPPMDAVSSRRLDYGMVNVARFEEGRIAEMWFGIDPLVEMQQMGMAPQPRRRKLSRSARVNLESFFKAEAASESEYDTVAAFDDVVVALGPPQEDRDTMTRWVEVYSLDAGLPDLLYSHEFRTKPPCTGDPGVAKEISRSIVERWFDQVLNCHSRLAVEASVSPHLLIHPSAMPCEAAYHGVDGAMSWLDQHWAAFGDVTVAAELSVAHGEFVAVRWTAHGMSQGEFMGQAPTGKPIEFDGISMYRIEQGRIAEIWETRNTYAILHQLNPEIGTVPVH